MIRSSAWPYPWCILLTCWCCHRWTWWTVLWDR